MKSCRKRCGWWFGFGLGCGLIGCTASQEQLAWQVARDSNAPSDYANYMRQYPSGAHAEEARWEAVRRTDTVSAYLDFLRANPSSSRKSEVEERISAATAKPLSVSDSTAYLAYVRTQVKNPSKKTLERAGQVRAKLEPLEWDAARSSGDLLQLVFFLRKYPASSHAADAQALVMEKRFEAVSKMSHPLAYQAFLQFYPKGSRSDEARVLLEKSQEPSGTEDPGAFDPKAALKDAAAKDPALERQGCSVILASRIRKGGADFEIDAWREHMNGLRNNDSPMPPECAGLPGLTLDAENKAAAARAARLLLHGREDLEAFAGRVKTMQDRADLVKRSSKAADQLAQQLESDELSEGVLGGGALGGVDLGLAEKGSATAMRAKERLEVLAAAAASHADTSAKLLRTQAGQADAVRFYLMSLLKVES
ncbi:MAG: hypothetical protein WC859_09445 [Elusimicrobiota bacterium]|jgi:hypothetical protein